MTRDEALKALDDALSDRIGVEYDHLADGYMGSANARVAAQATFGRGLGLHIEAYAFAVEVITKKFEGETNDKG